MPLVNMMNGVSSIESIQVAKVPSGKGYSARVMMRKRDYKDDLDQRWSNIECSIEQAEEMQRCIGVILDEIKNG